MLNRDFPTVPRRPGVRAWATAGFTALILTGCNSLLDVKNPNRIVEDDLANPASATAQTNGLGHSVTRALTAILAPYSDATDELQYVGSRDSYDQLDRGFVALTTNEFVDASWPYVTEARYMADATIKRLEAFKAEGKLANPLNLARTYIYGAVIYSAAADMFDDFVIATVDAAGRKVANPSLGNARMTVLYDSAITFTTRALAMPELAAAGNAALRAQALAIRARAKYSKGLFAKTRVGPWVAGPSTAALVTDAQGGNYMADVTAALAAGSGDWGLVLTPRAVTLGFPILGNDINNRLELRAGDAYIVPSAAGGGKRVGSIRLQDPINNIPDPALTRAINSCCVQAVSDFVPITVASAREMRLLQAEAALAGGDIAGFQTAINALRAFETGLSPWTPASTVSALDLLIHERRVNLFLQGKRLRDMYRFGQKDPQWLTTSTAYKISGCMLVLTQAERDPNPNVKPPSPGCE